MKRHLYWIVVLVLVCVVVIQQAFLNRAAYRSWRPGDAGSGALVVSALGSVERDRSNVLEFIRDRAWEGYPAPPPPSDALIQHADRFGTARARALPWLAEARTLAEGGRTREAAETIITGVARDRAYLSFLIDEIDAVAFGLVNELALSDAESEAAELVSACAVASGDPVAYMRHLLERMPGKVIAAIWPDDPYVTLVRFDATADPAMIRPAVDFQSRETLSWEIEPGTGHDGGKSARIEAGEATRDGDLIVGWLEPFMSLSPGPSGLRLYARAERPEPFKLAVHAKGMLGNGQPFRALCRSLPAEPLEGGWLRFDTRSLGDDLFDVLMNQFGWLDPWYLEDLQISHLEDAHIRLSGVGLDLPPGPANTWWLDRIELYIPAGSWDHAPQVAEPSGFGRAWRPVDHGSADEEMTEEEFERFEALEALGYLGAVTSAPAEDGVLVHNRDRAWPGLNFYVTGPSTELYLMDMDGNILHTWRPDPEDPAWPEDEFPMAARFNMAWRRAHLFPNGDVLAIQEGRSLVKMDKDSNIIWAKAGGYHHDLRIMDDGTIYVLDRAWEPLPNAGPRDETLVDYIAILDADGSELRRVSILKAVEDSPYAPMLYSLNYAGDIFHTNSIQVLDGQLSDRIPAFREGNVLVCLLFANLVAVVDMDLEQVVWGISGQWLHPHDPKLLPGDTMMIFDNKGASWDHRMYPASSVIEFDPVTREVVWEYTGSRDEPFYSNVCGAAWHLPNDNILITETTRGRVFEVTREKEIVWEYINPERSGEDDALIGVVNELIRYPLDYADGWLERTGNSYARRRAPAESAGPNRPG